MARGSVAKEAVIKKIAAAFGEDFIGEFDKKVYVWAVENGERLQIAMTLTCPKNPIVVADKGVSLDGGDFDFSDEPGTSNVAVQEAPPAEITQEEQDRIAEMMKNLGL